MTDITTQSLPRYEMLSWDTEHYGFNIGRITGDVWDEHALGRLLQEGKSEGARLVYFLQVHPFTIDGDLLQRFGGLRVGGHVRFVRPHLSSPPDTGEAVEGLSLEVFRGSVVDPHVVALGVAAGWLSRFRTDPRLSPEKCDELYAIWITRSILGELADEVLIARLDDVPVGLVTYQTRGSYCEIGLVATAQTVRGRGIGYLLLTFAHQRMALRGASRGEVATQTENIGACRLYERAGYSPALQGDYFHFLLH